MPSSAIVALVLYLEAMIPVTMIFLSATRLVLIRAVASVSQILTTRTSVQQVRRLKPCWLEISHFLLAK